MIAPSLLSENSVLPWRMCLAACWEIRHCFEPWWILQTFASSSYLPKRWSALKHLASLLRYTRDKTNRHLPFCLPPSVNSSFSFVLLVLLIRRLDRASAALFRLQLDAPRWSRTATVEVAIGKVVEMHLLGSIIIGASRDLLGWWAFFLREKHAVELLIALPQSILISLVSYGFSALFNDPDR